MMASGETRLARTAGQARRMAVAAQGFTEPPPDRPGRPPPPAQGVRPHRRDPDRLGQRARAQPGAAAVRPARAAPALAARRRRRRRRAVRVLGPHGGHHPQHRTTTCSAGGWSGPPRGSAVARLERAAAGLHRRGASSASARDGPLTAADLEQRVGPKGPWWDWDDGKIALEYLFRRRASSSPSGAAATSPGSTTSPSASCRRACWRPDADRSRGPQGAAGAGRPGAAAWRRSPTSPTTTARAPTACRPLVAELVEEGRLLPCEVEGWDRPAYPPRRRRRRRDASTAGRCSARSTRWCGTATATSGCSASTTASRSTRRPPKRVYGYYVLPFLLDGELVGRVDLKADRAAGVLRVQARPRRARRHRVADAGELAGELRLMAGWLGLDARRRRRTGGARARAADGPASPLTVDAGRVCLDRTCLESVADPNARRRAGDATSSALRAAAECERDRRCRRRRGASERPTPAALGGPRGRRLLGRVPRRPRRRASSGRSCTALFVLLAISVFLALAIEPGVNRLARRGWRRGTATALILFGVARHVPRVRRRHRHAGRLADRRPAVRTPRRTSRHRRRSINDTFGTNLDAQEVIDDFNDPDGAVQEFIRDQQDDGGAAVGRRARRAAAAAVGAAVHVLPRRRRAEDAPGDLQPAHAGAPGAGAARRGSWPATRPAATSTRGRCWR